MESKYAYKQFELFLNSLLQEDLKLAYEAREKLKQQFVEFDELKHTIELIKVPEVQENGLQSSLNIGCDFYVDATVKDVSKIMVNIGANVFIECTLDESLKLIAKKQKLLEHQIEYMTSKVSQIEGYITLYMSSVTLECTSSNQTSKLDNLEDVEMDICGNAIHSQDSITEAVQKLLLNNMKSS